MHLLVFICQQYPHAHPCMLTSTVARLNLLALYYISDSIFYHVYICCILPLHIFYRVLDAYLGLVLVVTLYVRPCKCVGFVGL